MHYVVINSPGLKEMHYVVINSPKPSLSVGAIAGDLEYKSVRALPIYLKSHSDNIGGLPPSALPRMVAGYYPSVFHFT